MAALNPTPSAPGRAKQLRLLLLLAAGLALGLLAPPPTGVEVRDWHLLTLFILTVAGILWQPYPVPVLVIAALALGSSTGIITLQQALSGFSSSVTWIILAAFLFARAFVKTGLGRRIALTFIRHLGRSSLRLGYSLALTDLVLAPVTPSNSARAGGIVFPVARSLAGEFGSKAASSPRKIGAYLLFTAYQANVVTSAMFLTAMAANALSVELARQTSGAEISWGLWFTAASVPGLLSILIVPWLIHKAYPPQLQETRQAQEYARSELEQMGPASKQEKLLGTIFVLLASVWATSSFHSVSTVAAALSAVSLLLVLDVLQLDDVVGEKPAWGTFLWFGGMLSLAGALSQSGIIDWFVELLKGGFSGSQGMAALLVLALIYFYLHYFFVSMTAQIIALYVAFLATALAAGAPALLASLMFCFFSNLYASLTHYADGCAPIFYGSGYIEQSDWWRVGFYLSLANLSIWLGVGLVWWRWLGIW